MRSSLVIMKRVRLGNPRGLWWNWNTASRKATQRCNIQVRWWNRTPRMPCAHGTNGISSSNSEHMHTQYCRRLGNALFIVICWCGIVSGLYLTGMLHIIHIKRNIFVTNLQFSVTNIIIWIYIYIYHWEFVAPFVHNFWRSWGKVGDRREALSGALADRLRRHDCIDTASV